MSVQNDTINPDLEGLPPAEDPTPLLRRWINAWNNRDVGAMLDCFADDAVVRLVPPPAPPAPEVYRGRREIEIWLREQGTRTAGARIDNVRMLGNVVTWDTTIDDASVPTINVSEAVVANGKFQDYTP
jgi:hypothetical protein